jgi:hypothetical protein
MTPAALFQVVVIMLAIFQWFCYLTMQFNNWRFSGCVPCTPASAIFTFGTAFIFGRLPGVEVCWHRGRIKTSRQIANHGQTESGFPVVFSFKDR